MFLLGCQVYILHSKHLHQMNCNMFVVESMFNLNKSHS